MATIGERLKIVRTRDEYSQVNYASDLNVSLTTYKSYETNKTNIPHTILKKIKEKSNVSLDWLVCGIGTNEDIDTLIGEYFESINDKNNTISVHEVFKRLVDEVSGDKKDKKQEIEIYKEKNINKLLVSISFILLITTILVWFSNI